MNEASGAKLHVTGFASLKGIAILIEALGEEHYRVEAARERLLTLYERWDRPEQALDVRRTLGGPAGS